ncbi:MAG: sigma-54 dependent transcriptional regulator [Pseudomonadota bacterium]
MREDFTNLLVVDDDRTLTKVFEKLSKDHTWSYSVAMTGTEARDLLGQNFFEVALIDVRLPGFTGIQILEYIKQNNLPTEVVIMTGLGTVETAVDAIKKGAYDYLTKPFDDIERVARVIEKAMERNRLVRRLHILERKSPTEVEYEGIIGKSPRMQEIYATIDAIAPTPSTVLILGESGTGKELIARAIHRRSTRVDKPFVVINCAAIPSELLESELFGHKRGSFTGAIMDKKGLFEEADGGTVFLDEIADIPPNIQVKLLRVLQEGEIRAVGENNSQQVDVRIVAATNVDLVKAVHDGRFREDLFYRLNVIGINLPPLRERLDDIPILAQHFLDKYNKRANKSITTISIDAMQSLQHYRWVGNVRELENIIERAVVLTRDNVIRAQDLPSKVLGDSFYQVAEEVKEDITHLSYRLAKEKALSAFNRAYITALMKDAKGNISIAADKAGMDRSNFKKLIKRYKMDIGKFRD